MASGRSDNCAGCFFFDYHNLTALGNVTFDLANPTFVNAPGVAPAALNTPVVFSTAGALPSPIDDQTIYWAIPVDVNNFQIAATPGGPPIGIINPGMVPHTAQVVVTGCHRDAPQSSSSTQSGQPAQATWQPVPFDYWCGEFLNSYPSSVATWSAFTSVLGASGGGAYGSATITGRQATIGKVIFFNVEISITNAGTAAGNVTFTLPAVAAADASINGFDSTNNKPIAGRVLSGSFTATIWNADASSAIGVHTLLITGLYEQQ